MPKILFAIDPMILILRKRYLYLKRRVREYQKAYFASENVRYFWCWIDAGLELIKLKEYAALYKKTAYTDTTEFVQELRELI